ncbi:MULTISPECIES: hypothetical protein [Bacillales]|uniref:hypothetical protein n=1 Tax=Bacillales TaxID=1385 RepID=UPI00039AAA80|nr:MULTISPECIES: hypothetical protein [Bacillales]MBZ9536699.1 hypothetical protein [Cytobacillus oceanisediminis]MCM3364801.1 hypothetical protein [Niallia sp. MER TA 168]HEO8422721.1 hypothetical protein [Yersinia enterocolitica]
MKSNNNKKRKIQAKYRKLTNKNNKNDKFTEKIAIIFALFFLIILFLNIFIKSF